MGTRSGDIDPAVLFHLARRAGMSIDDLDDLLNKRSGVLGLAGRLRHARHRARRRAGRCRGARSPSRSTSTGSAPTRAPTSRSSAASMSSRSPPASARTRRACAPRALADARVRRGRDRPGAQRGARPRHPGHLDGCLARDRPRRARPNEELEIARQTLAGRGRLTPTLADSVTRPRPRRTTLAARRDEEPHPVTPHLAWRFRGRQRPARPHLLRRRAVRSGRRAHADRRGAHARVADDVRGALRRMGHHAAVHRARLLRLPRRQEALRRRREPAAQPRRRGAVGRSVRSARGRHGVRDRQPQERGVLARAARRGHRAVPGFGRAARRSSLPPARPSRSSRARRTPKRCCGRRACATASPS